MDLLYFFRSSARGRAECVTCTVAIYRTSEKISVKAKTHNTNYPQFRKEWLNCEAFLHKKAEKRRKYCSKYVLS